MVEIVEIGPVINELQIAAIARKLGCVLANDYKNFLLANNGGRPKPDVIDIKNLPESPTDVQEFFAIGGDTESSEILWNLESIMERCPDYHVLPIACDSSGSLFCLKVVNGIASSVVFCDFNSQSCDLYDVAPSFDEFLKMLREWE